MRISDWSSDVCSSDLMPLLERYFHYRNLDVSTLKELARRWAPQVLAAVNKTGTHTALADIEESIAELRHYRQHMGTLGGMTGSRSEERRVGKECVSTCRARWAPDP